MEAPINCKDGIGEGAGAREVTAMTRRLSSTGNGGIVMILLSV